MISNFLKQRVFYIYIILLIIVMLYLILVGICYEVH